MKMENSLSFIIPETDLHFRLTRMLIIVDNLSYSSRGKPILTLEKASLFEYLVKYPKFLRSVLKVVSVKEYDNFILYDEEVDSVETLYPNQTSLYDFSGSKVLLKILIMHNLVEVNVIKGEIFYIITQQGTEVIKKVETSNIKRTIEVCNGIKALRSVSTSQLNKIIKPIVKGV